MKRETLSIIVVCALGAFIGTLLALDIAARFQYGSYLWGIGALVGGMVAYVAVDFRQFLAGIVHSYHATIAWRPNPLYWKAVGMTYLAFMSIVSTASLFLAVGIFAMEWANTRDLGMVLDKAWSTRWAGVFVVVMVMVFFLWMSMSINKYNKDHSPRQNLVNWLRARRMGYKMAADANVFNVSVKVIYYSLKGLWQIVAYSPHFVAEVCRGFVALVVGIAQFVAGVFVYVHSSRRTLCFVDASLGAAIGYSYGSAVVGAVAGAVLGVTNYELVSVRWLKLVPRTTR